MFKKTVFLLPLVLPLFVAMFFLAGCRGENVSAMIQLQSQQLSDQAGTNGKSGASDDNTAILGGGCFWCVESDFEKLPGALDVVAGYSGGTTENPSYENYAEGGHIEVVKVTFDPARVNFAGLVEWLIKHSDPTDDAGSFGDRGMQYIPVVYFENDEQKMATEKVIKAIDAMRVFDEKIAIKVAKREKFWPAEDYHQNYHLKNRVDYDDYRSGSGRDEFIKKHWGDRSNRFELPESIVSTNKKTDPWVDFKKPPKSELKKELNAQQYRVTQENGTESPF